MTEQREPRKGDVWRGENHNCTIYRKGPKTVMFYWGVRRKGVLHARYHADFLRDFEFVKEAADGKP